MKRCPWCGNEDDCQQDIPGQSPHHRLCCLDQFQAKCRTPPSDDVLARITSEHNEERWSA